MKETLEAHTTDGSEVDGDGARDDSARDEFFVMRGIGLTFGGDMEGRFENERAPDRARDIVTSGLAVVVMLNLFLIVDYLTLPDVFKTIAFIRIAVVTPLMLLGMLAIRLRPKPHVSERISLGSAVLVMASLVYGFTVSHSRSAGYYEVGLILILAFTNVILQLRFVYACVSCALQVLVYSCALLVSPGLPWSFRGAAIVMASFGAAFALLANWRLERNERKTYLLTLREQRLSSYLQAQNRNLQELSWSDPLTGVANRRLFDERVAKIWQRALIDRRPLGILMIDVDRFKAFNDIYGHPRGDDCLRQVANALRLELRASTDVLARYGGEEFVVALPGLSLEACLEIGERMRTKVASLGIRHDGAEGVRCVTVSIGVAVRMIEPALRIAELISDADGAMYRAKRAGRNRVVSAYELATSQAPA
jgi:diguanylate cyclase (GGDEF)-like protein